VRYDPDNADAFDVTINEDDPTLPISQAFMITVTRKS
jgi:hypothetical protein